MVGYIAEIHKLENPFIQYHAGKLRARHKAILEFVYDHTYEHGYAPTMREIGKATGVTSTSVVNYNVSQLTKWGFLHRTDGRSRSILLSEYGYRVLGKHNLADLQAELVRLLLENRSLKERCEQLEHWITKQT